MADALLKEFEAYKSKFGKTYPSGVEEQRRFANFRASVARVAHSNAERAARGADQRKWEIILRAGVAAAPLSKTSTFLCRTCSSTRLWFAAMPALVSLRWPAV